MFDESLKTFVIFSLSHGLAAGFFLVLYILLIVYRKALAARPRLCRILEVTTAGLMLLMQLGFYLWTFALGNRAGNSSPSASVTWRCISLPSPCFSEARNCSGSSIPGR